MESAKGISYFTPAHRDTPGAPVNISQDTPTLFTPLKIRDVTLRNRIVVAPMCQYSTAAEGAQIGALTDYHVATLGHYALKGSSLVFVEATGVQPNGRISPHCPGIWSDDQIPGLKRVADFIHSQGSVCGIQLAHAGRKSSTMPPWISARQKKPSTRAQPSDGGWPNDVVGPTGGDSWDGKGDAEDGGYFSPRQLTVAEIRELVGDFAAAAERSVKAGVGVIEIHAAHGYLIHQFLSPVTNRRSDAYGGSFENRVRILVEVIQAVRQVIPPGMPLFLRMSSTEWLEETDLGKKYGSWDVESTIRVAKMLPSLGVDLLDVSSGGNHPEQRIQMFNAKDYQIKIAKQVRQVIHEDGLDLLIGAVGLITEAKQARDIVQATGEQEVAGSRDNNPSIAEEAAAAVKMTDATAGKEAAADVILVARQFMREPEWVLKVASVLEVDVSWPSQFLRVRFPKVKI